MANLPETEDFAEGTYQIETSDRVIGGPGGIANKQAEQLGNRTAWLRAAIRKIIDGTTAIGKATQLATARTLRFKGAVNGSGSFDGSADTEITLTLADSGIAPGSYTKITLNAKGLATAGSSPTTLSGLGISDAFTKTETAAAVQQAVANLVASSPAALDTLKELADALGNDPNFAATMTNALAAKASKAELNTAVSTLLPKAGGTVSGSIVLNNGTIDSPEISWQTPGFDIRADAVGKTLRFFAVNNGETTFPLTLDVINKSVQLFGNTAWHSGNFNPVDYVKKGQVLVPGESPKCMSAATGSIGGISGDASALEVRGNANGAALVSFHRPGNFGAHLGIDTDNQLKVGGWSMGPVAHTIWHAGNFYPGGKADKGEVSELANKVSALEGRQVFTKAFTSPEQTIMTNGYLSIPHGLGVPPVLWESYLVCKEAEHGYWPGATILVPSAGVDNLYSLGISVVPDGINLNCKFGSQPGVFFVLHWGTGSTGIITPSKWRLVVRAWA